MVGKRIEPVLEGFIESQYGRLRSLFICLDDDLRRPAKDSSGAPGSSAPGASAPGASADTGSAVDLDDESAFRPVSNRGSKRGPPSSMGSTAAKSVRH